MEVASTIYSWYSLPTDVLLGKFYNIWNKYNFKICELRGIALGEIYLIQMRLQCSRKILKFGFEDSWVWILAMGKFREDA